MLRLSNQGTILSGLHECGYMDPIKDVRIDQEPYTVAYRNKLTKDEFGFTNFKRIVRTNPDEPQPYFLNEERTDFLAGRWLLGERLDTSKHFLFDELVVPEETQPAKRFVLAGAAVAIGGAILTGGLGAPIAVGVAAGTMGKLAERALRKDYLSGLRQPKYFASGITGGPRARPPAIVRPRAPVIEVSDSDDDVFDREYWNNQARYENYDDQYPWAYAL